MTASGLRFYCPTCNTGSVSGACPVCAPSKHAGRLVNCDATYDTASGLGFIAITGVVGQHVRRVECGSNIAAEALAILYAMELGQAERGKPRLIFRTDCEVVVIGIQPGARANANREIGKLLAQVRRTLSHRRQFEVQHVERAEVGPSHRLAARARRAYAQGEPGSTNWSPLWRGPA